MTEIKNINQKRDISIDILRFIGISLIILAHITPPDEILNIRCFDVPLMLFISGLTLSPRQPDFSLKYFKHRTIRLLLPVYVFLTIYFLLVFGLQNFGLDFGVKLHHCVGSYLLQDGIGYVWIIIGYVWIIRVFLLIALVTPFLLFLQKSLNVVWLFLGCIVTMAVLDSLISLGYGMQSIVIRDYLYYTLGYSVPFICGLIFPNLTLKKQIVFTVSALALLFVSAAIIGIRSGYSSPLGIFTEGNLLIFNNFKYPPQSYFLIYGVLMSAILYLIIVKGGIYRYLTIFEFIGCNTIWLYLYHIPIVQLTGKMDLHWSVRYFVVYILAFALTYAQVKLISYLQTRVTWGHHLNFLKG